MAYSYVGNENAGFFINTPYVHTMLCSYLNEGRLAFSSHHSDLRVVITHVLSVHDFTAEWCSQQLFVFTFSASLSV